MKVKKQQIYFKDRDLTTLALETKVANIPNWKWETGKGQTDTRIQLDYDFDYVPSYVSGNNICDIYEISEDNPRGLHVYRGIIGEVKPYLDSGDQGIEVEVLGLSSMTQWSYFTTVSSETTVSYTGSDVSTMFTDIIDHWQSVHSSTLINYTPTSISATGKSIDYDFVNRKHGDALKEAFKFADSDWYWYIDCDGIVYLQPLPATATHTFIINKDVKMSDATQTFKDIINSQTVDYNGGSATVTDAISISTFGTHEGKLITDNDIQNVGSATERATAELITTAQITGNIEVTSEYADLPNMRVGETCRLKNYDETYSILGDNMPIVSIRYDWDTAVLELGEIRSNIAQEITNLIINQT